MKRPQIIGLTGPRGVGKTTIAELLSKHVSFSALAFGDLLRNQICTAFAVDLELFTRRDLKDTASYALSLVQSQSPEFSGAMVKHLSQESKDHHLMDRLKEPRSPREIMKFWAEQYRKPLFGQQYFSRAVVNRIHLEQSHHQLRHVVHDVRFPIEAAAIRSMGGTIWQIKRPSCEADPSDPTETDGSEFNPAVVIHNEHDAKHLQAIVMAEWLRSETGICWKVIANMGSVAVNSHGASA